MYGKEVELVEKHLAPLPTVDEVIEEITTNEEYKPNLKEILAKYFEENPKAKDEWVAWLGGR